MTKDLAMCISEGKPVKRSAYCTTQEFMERVSETFAASMKSNAIAKAKL